MIILFLMIVLTSAVFSVISPLLFNMFLLYYIIYIYFHEIEDVEVLYQRQLIWNIH